MTNYGYRQYLRQYRLIVTSKSAGVGFDVSDLRIKFKVEKAVKATGNNAQILVYNVSPESVAAVQAGDNVILEAGYKGGNYGMIYAGTVVQTFMEHSDSVDNAMVIMAQDADKFLTKKIVVKTIGAGASQADIVNDIIADNKEVSGGQINSALSSTLLPRGKVLFGKAADYVQQIAKSNNSTFYVENGTLNIVGAQQYASNIAVELAPTTGLVGVPEQTEKGVKGKCLINPSLKLNTLIHIDTKYTNALVNADKGASGTKKMNASGIYKVIKLTYSGDTRDSDWYCEFEADAVSGKVLGAVT